MYTQSHKKIREVIISLLRVLSPQLTKYVIEFFSESRYILYMCALQIFKVISVIKSRYMYIHVCLHVHALLYLFFFLNIIPLYVFHLVFVRHMILNLHFQEMVFFSVFFFQNVSVVYFTFKLYVYLFSGESKERPRLVKRRMVYKGCFVTFTTCMY